MKFYKLLAKELVERFHDAEKNGYDPELMISVFLAETFGTIKHHAVEFDTVSEAIKFYRAAKRAKALSLLDGKKVYTNIPTKRIKKILDRFGD